LNSKLKLRCLALAYPPISPAARSNPHPSNCPGSGGHSKVGQAGLSKSEATRRRLKVRFTRAADLVQSLIEARDERRLTALQQRYQKVALLVVDELGFVPF
jgi:hypothetical protein